MADFNLSDAFGSFLNMFPGVGNGNLGTASVIPSLASAWNQYRDAGRYEDLGREAGAVSNPFTNEMRQGYAGNLSNYYKDPTSYLKQNPEFMASMDLGTDKIKAENAIRGNYNGEATPDQLRFLSKLSSQYVNQDLQRLMQLSGANFNNSPQQGNLMMRGGEAAIQSRNNALDALMAPLGAQAAGNRVNGGNQTTQPAGYGMNPNNMNGGLGNLPNSLSGLFGINTGFGPGLEEIYGNLNSGNWNYMPQGWADQLLGPVGPQWDDMFQTIPGMDGGDIPYWDDGFDGGGDWSFDWGSP